MVEFLGLTSLLAIIFTFGLGYVVIHFAYRFAKKLHIWHELSDFDKAMRTFIVGGAISWTVFLFSNAPIESSSASDWWRWLLQPLPIFWFALLTALMTFLLWSLLAPSK